MSRIEKAMEKAAQLRQGNTATLEKIAPPASTISSLQHNPEERQTPVLSATSDSPLLVNLNTPYSAGAEEFRKVKGFILNKTKEDGFKNTIMVTSALPGEGKTISSLNLAISLAEELDHTVLLIEADLRRPTMHQYLNLEDKPGFSSCLLGEADLRDCIIPTGIGKLSIIRAGHSVPNPAELFSSQRTRDLITEIKSRYHDRYIIFDTPPILPFTEARSLGKLVDGTIFVAMERQTTTSNMKEALDVLKDCPMLGVIYNNTEQTFRDKRYSYYQHYSENSREVSSGV